MESRGAPHCLHPWPALPRARLPCLCEISPFQVPDTPLGSRLCDGTRSHPDLPCPSVCENTMTQCRHGRGGAANARLVHPSVYPSPGTSPMAAGNASIALMRYLFLTTNRAACRSSYHGFGQRSTMQSGTTARSALLVGSVDLYSYAFSCQDTPSRNSNRASSQRRMAVLMFHVTRYIAMELMYPCLVSDRHVRIELPSTILVQHCVTPTNLQCVHSSLQPL
jgi:hypothetical protein